MRRLPLERESGKREASRFPSVRHACQFILPANVRLPQVRQPRLRRVSAKAEALPLLPVPPEEALGKPASHLEPEEQVGGEAGEASAGEGHGERGTDGGTGRRRPRAVVRLGWLLN